MDLSALPVSVKLLAGVGGAATVAGVGVSASSAASTSYPALTFNNTSELGNFNGGPCVKAILDPKQQELLNQREIWAEDGNSWTNKFKNSTGKSRGCVALSWDKKTWKDDHGRGTIRYEWLFTKGDEAILVNGFYDSSATDEDPSQQQQNSDKNNGKAVYINRKTQQVQRGSNKLETNKAWLMWQKRQGIETLLLTKPKIIDDNAGGSFDKSKKCDGDKCNGPSLDSQHEVAKGKWEQGDKIGDRTFGDWHSHFDTIFDFIYQGGTKSAESLKNIVNGEKGTGVTF